MKHLKNLFLAGTALVLMVASAEAQSAFKTDRPFARIHKKAQVEKLDAGSQLVLVCKDSDTVTHSSTSKTKSRRCSCAPMAP